MLFFKRQESVLTATKQEQRDAIDRLISSSSVRSGYYLLLFIASVITTSALLLNNIAVVIGGMILAPLLTPILLLSLSLLNGSLMGCFASVRVIFTSMIVAIATAFTCSVLLNEIYVLHIPMDIAVPPAGIAFLIAGASGTAAAFAWVKEDLAPTIAGVAVAVSLLPPLNSVGIGLAIGVREMMVDGYITFLSNLIGIVSGAFIVFLILGFIATNSLQEKAIKKEEKKNGA